MVVAGKAFRTGKAKACLVAVILAAAGRPALADEPDGLKLPFGFHAQVVADGVGPGARHIAIHGNHLYISTRRRTDSAPPSGVIAVELTADHKAANVSHFGTVDNGTGIGFYRGALYATSPSTVYRFRFKGRELVPGAEPDVIVDGLPTKPHESVGMAFDKDGHIYLDISGGGNVCFDPKSPKGAPPKGLDPCPGLDGRGGVWRFSSGKTDQKFPADGEQWATGIRDMMAMSWSPDINSLFGVMQDRNGTSRSFGHIVSAETDANDIAEEMHRMDKGANLGWPYTYYDLSLHKRVVAPEYGGDGRTAPKEDYYSTPVVAFRAHQSPLDLLFYDGKQFPSAYRGGAFVVFQGGSSGGPLPSGHGGYDVVFVPFDRHGNPGQAQIFADGFAGPNAADRNPGKAAYRPSGAAVGPDGSLYIVDTLKGRLWRIFYTGQ